MSLAANIRRLRLSCGLTQAKAAYGAAISTSAYRRLEAGRVVNPQPELLARIADMFDVRLRELSEEPHSVKARAHESIWRVFVQSLALPPCSFSREHVEHVIAIRGQLPGPVPATFVTGRQTVLMTWDTGRLLLGVDVCRDGQFDWFYRDRETDELDGTEDSIGGVDEALLARMAIVRGELSGRTAEPNPEALKRIAETLGVNTTELFEEVPPIRARVCGGIDERTPDATALRRLADEGRQLRREFEKRAAPMTAKTCPYCDEGGPR